MKTKMTLLFSMLWTLTVSAQEDNRLNNIGKQYLTVVNNIRTDVQTGRMAAITQESIDGYLATLPFKAEMNLELAGKLHDLKKAGPINFEKFIGQSKGISDEAKKMILKIVMPKGDPALKGALQKQVNYVNDIERSSMAPAEKEMLLALQSTAFNVREQSALQLTDGGGYGNGFCTVESPDGTTIWTAEECVIAAAAIGFTVGFQTCGIWCGVGGAIIFGVIAVIAVC